MRPLTVAACMALSLTALAGCLSDATRGNADSVDDGTTTSPDGDTAVVVDTTTSSDSDTTTAPDTVTTDATADADAVVDTDAVAGVCGDGLLEPGEACDDGNTCALDGCRAELCAPEPTLMLTSLALDASVLFDLNDGDEDGDIYTHGDNRLAGGYLETLLDPLIEAAIRGGDLIQLVTFGALDDPGDDQDISLTFHPGVDPACPPGAQPPWVGGGAAHSEVYSDARAFEICEPDVTGGAPGAPATGIYAARFNDRQPPAPVLYADFDGITLKTSALGAIAVTRGHLEATAQIADGELVGLDDGRLGGIIPLDVFARVDTTAIFGARCPTGLHMILGLLGQPDMDADGGVGVDFILTTAPLEGTPCVETKLTIVACCDEGSCAGDDRISGADCFADPRIRDGYSVGYTFTARAVTVTGQVDGGSYCAP